MSFSRAFLNTSVQNLLITSVVLLFSSWCLAEQRLITNDGREVIVHEDGTWEFASEDRYATTADGKQVQLKADGSWSFIENIPGAENVYPVANNVQPGNIDTVSSLVNVQLNDAFVEEYSEKAGAQSKNTRTYRYINFLLDVSLSAEAKDSLSLQGFDPQDFVVTDDRGSRYEVIRVEGSSTELQPGNTAQLGVVTDGAPGTLVRVRDAFLSIAPNALKTESNIELEVNYRGLDRKNISRKY